MKSILQVWREYLASLNKPEYKEIWIASAHTNMTTLTFNEVSDIVPRGPVGVSFTITEDGNRRRIDIEGYVVYKEEYLY